MSFRFGGNDPDEVGNLGRQLNEMRVVAQNMQDENAMLRLQLEELTAPAAPTVHMLLLVNVLIHYDVL